MPYNIRMVSTYPPRKCGIGTFSRDMADAMKHFTGEIGHIRIAAIDNDHLTYSIPVDIVIDQFSPQCWTDATEAIIKRAKEASNPTVILLQHEYGLDPDPNGNNARGTNFVDMAGTFRKNNLTTLVYLHTVLDEPDEHQRQVIRRLAEYSDGLIVTTESAIDILESGTYDIDHFKLKHIDHGIRMQHPSDYDRLEIKKQFGLKDMFLVTTLGLLSPGKGIQYGIRAYGRFVSQSCTEAQRKQILYLIAGQPHPEFVKAENGKHYRRYLQELAVALEESGLKWCRVKELDSVTDWEEYDVVFLDAFLDESILLKIYGAANVVVLPYLNTQQISSGILADTLGAGRIAIATKFRYALELIHSNRPVWPGLMIGRYVRGILVDPGPDGIDQIARALDYIVFNEVKRLTMERQAHQRGYQMRWDNSAWALIQYIDFVREKNMIVTGRGRKFVREKTSPLQITVRNPKTNPLS